MEQRLSVITLGVDDLQKARAFYDALGWQAASDDTGDQGIVAYNLNGMALCLYPREKLADDAQVPQLASGFSSITLAYNVNAKEDVAAVLAEAAAAGGTIIKQAQDVFWGGHSGYFADPDGHLWEVAYNPFSPLGPDGAFQWGA